MKKKFLLSALVSVPLFLAACGDDGSGSTTTPSAPETDISSASETGDPGQGVEPGSSSSVVVDTESSADGAAGVSSSADAGSDPVEGSSASTAEISTVEFVVEPVSSGSTYNCTETPDEMSGGVEVTCDGEYSGIIKTDNDASVYDPDGNYLDDFVAVQKVAEKVGADEKVVILLRHAQRPKDDEMGVLTGLGELQAISVGKKLASLENPIFYHSSVRRTEQTCHKIAQGMGLAEIKHAALPELSGDWFVKDSEMYSQCTEQANTSYDIISGWAFGGQCAEAHYELAARAQELINDAVVGKMFASGRVSIAVSHDQMLVPLLAYLTQSQIPLNYSQTSDWLNFLAGVAVVQKADGTLKYVPVRGLKSGNL